MKLTPKEREITPELLTSEYGRNSLFPIRYYDIYAKYKNVEAVVWTAQETNTSIAEDSVKELSEKEWTLLKHLLAFFSNSDSIVNENIQKNLMSKVNVFEAKMFYDFQVHIENVHSETYSILIDTYVKDEAEKAKMFEAVKNIPTIAKKMAWFDKYLKEGDFVKCLIAQACLEGIQFSSTFALIFYFRTNSKYNLKGLCFANDLIRRDEQSHYDFAVFLYNNYIVNKVSNDVLRNMIVESCEVELQFIEDILDDSTLLGITKQDVKDYVKFVTDNVLVDFKLDKHYHSKNRLTYMNVSLATEATNMFEKKHTNYVAGNKENAKAFSLNEEF